MHGFIQKETPKKKSVLHFGEALFFWYTYMHVDYSIELKECTLFGLHNLPLNRALILEKLQVFITKMHFISWNHVDRH